MVHSNNLGWIDLEMTGLDVDDCTIIEIASVVTDENLEVIATGPNIAVHQTKEIMSQMDEWNTQHHGDSGLTERVINSTIKMREAEEQTIEFLSSYLEKGKSPLCGNSIYQDRIFLARYMPKLNNFFHYRNIDVSTVKELSYRWYADTPRFEKKGAHLALDDIMESIGELKYYRQWLFK